MKHKTELNEETQPGYNPANLKALLKFIYFNEKDLEKNPPSFTLTGSCPWSFIYSALCMASFMELNSFFRSYEKVATSFFVLLSGLAHSFLRKSWPHPFLSIEPKLRVFMLFREKGHLLPEYCFGLGRVLTPIFFTVWGFQVSISKRNRKIYIQTLVKKQWGKP